jgi:hypothetical protein
MLANLKLLLAAGWFLPSSLLRRSPLTFRLPLTFVFAFAILAHMGGNVLATYQCPPGYVFNGCTCVKGGYSPIILDTAGEGFHLTSAEGGVTFDIVGDGRPIQMAWTAAASRNAFLALDRNHNGKIDNGKELFGNFTDQPPCPDGGASCRNGYRALAEFDKPEKGGNGDGLIDRRDAVYSRLLLWVDENHDGVSQPSELHTLPELGVSSLSLGYKESRRTDEFGNQFRYKDAVNPDPQDGQSKDGRWAYDVFFVTIHENENAVMGKVGNFGQDQCTPPPAISGPDTVWWFNGQDPNPTTYPISIALSSTGGSETTWSVNQSDAKVNLSSTSGAQISVTSTGTHFSAIGGDISITATAGGLPSAPFLITSRTPAELSFLAAQSGTVCDSDYGYITDLNYNVLDQLNSVISSDIYWNEVVGTPIGQNGSNWGIYALETGGGSTPLLDRLSGPGVNNNPPPSPMPKCDIPPTGAIIYRLATQQIRVGTDTSGSGVDVQSDNLTYYIDNGAHTSIVIPPPPPK